MRKVQHWARERQWWAARLSPTFLGRVAGAGLLAVIVGITAFSIYSAVQSKDVVQRIQDNQRLSRAYEQTSAAFAGFDAATNAVLSAKAERMDGALKEYDRSLSNLTGRLDEIERYGNADDQAMVRGIRENFVPVAQAFREITASLPANPPGQPSDLIISRSKDLLDQRKDLVAKLRYSPDGSAPAVRAEQGLAEQPGSGPPTATFTSNYVTTFARLATEKVAQNDQLTSDYSAAQRKGVLGVVVLNLAGLALAGLFLVATRLFSLREASARSQLSHLRKTAHTDELTGLNNRRAFDDALSHATGEARESGNPLCLAMIDVDGFKRVNDTWGHERGDALLRTLAGVLRASVPDAGSIYRIGGDEFAVIFARTGTNEAMNKAELLRQAVQATVQHATLSIGVARYNQYESEAALRQHADAALYDAKLQGRNLVVLSARAASPPTDENAERAA